MIEYPNELEPIFETLAKQNINAIIVGGYIRDYFLNIESKDIDIELYGLSCLSEIESLLAAFGRVNSVGKSFGVCKLRLGEYELDFSLPREESKISSGHKGFSINTEKKLSFKDAASRRDFTINAMGFSINEKKLLDPFEGLSDLKNGILRAVNATTFADDPLRVLRMVVFSARFDLEIEHGLFELAREMIKNGALSELPKERIFGEFEKLFCKIKKPSKAFYFLESLGAFSFFDEFKTLENHQKIAAFESLDALAFEDDLDKKERIFLSLALLCRFFDEAKRESFLAKITTEKKLLQNIDRVLNALKKSDFIHLSNAVIYILATQIEIRLFVYFIRAAAFDSTLVDEIKNRALKLDVYTKPLTPLLQGADLVNLGLPPSREFSHILKRIYEQQMFEKIKTKEEAITWVKEEILNLL